MLLDLAFKAPSTNFRSILSLVPAVLGPIIKGEPLNYVFLVIALMFFVFAVVFFAASRRSGGGAGAPSA